MQYHPDLNQAEEAKEKFLKIKEAYKILNNDEERSAYNDKIGFHHPDPPPDFRHEWTLQGDKDKVAASLYYMKWDEKRIKELMYCDKLREVNWSDKTPSERYRILIEEERRQRELKNEQDPEELTPHQMYERTLFIFFMWMLFCTYVYGYVLLYEDEDYQKNRTDNIKATTDTETSNGTFIHHSARNAPAVSSMFSTNLGVIRKKRYERQRLEKEKFEAELQQSPAIFGNTETEAH